jgi:hypothetical protein
VRQAIIDETHRWEEVGLPRVGRGDKGAIVAGCDTIEHGFGLDQRQMNTVVSKKLYYEPTLVATGPYMDDNATRRHRRPVSDDSFSKGATMAAASLESNSGGAAAR